MAVQELLQRRPTLGIARGDREREPLFGHGGVPRAARTGEGRAAAGIEDAEVVARGGDARRRGLEEMVLARWSERALEHCEAVVRGSVVVLDRGCPERCTRVGGGVRASPQQQEALVEERCAGGVLFERARGAGRGRRYGGGLGGDGMRAAVHVESGVVFLLAFVDAAEQDHGSRVVFLLG